MIMVILRPIVPMGPCTTLICGQVGMDGGIHSGSTDTTTIMVLTIPIFGDGILQALEGGDTPVKQLLLKDN